MGENNLVFADETFDEAARKTERRYNVTIDLKDEKPLQRVVGSPFKAGIVEQASGALQTAFGFKFTEKGDALPQHVKRLHMTHNTS